MFFLLERLCRDIGNEKNIIIYGAGSFAIELYHKLCGIGWENRIECFAVSSVEAQPKYIDAIPVIKFEEKILDNNKICLLVAVGDKYIQEIRRALKGLSSERIFYLWEYRVTDDEKRETLLNCAFDELCQHALEEYIWNEPCRLINKVELFENLKTEICERKNQQSTDKSIVYILEQETARDVKIIKALLKKGFQITVLRCCEKERYGAEKELKDLGVVIKEFICLWDFMVVSLQYKPMLYFFDIESNFEYALVSIRHRDIWGKTVIAPYETFESSFIGLSLEVVEFEKFCLENADAVVWRFFSKEYLQNNLGYQYKGDSIQLLDNCGGYETAPPMLETSSGKLRLCCVVSQINSFLQQDIEIYPQQARFVDLLEKLDETCELHVFAWYANTDAQRQLKELEERYANFKFFLRIEHKDLIKRLSTYDYGLCVYTNENIPVYPAGAEMIEGGVMCTEGNYRYSVANRYFDYLDAEIAVITTLPEKLCEYLRRFDVIIGMNISNFDLGYLKANRGYYKKQAKAAKKELLMSRQISNLTDLFERICSDCEIT